MGKRKRTHTHTHMSRRRHIEDIKEKGEKKNSEEHINK